MSDDNLLRIERILSHSNKESRPPNFCENFKFCLWSPWNWAYIQKTPWNCAFFRDLGCFLELRRKLRVSQEFMPKHLDFILDNWKSCMHQVKYTWQQWSQIIYQWMGTPFSRSMMSAVDQLKRTSEVNPNTGSSVSDKNFFVFWSTSQKHNK